MRRALALVAMTFVMASCNKLLHREAPEASVESPIVAPTIVPPEGGSPSTLASALPTDDEEDDPLGGLHIGGTVAPTPIEAGACPMPIHPNYCRRRCRGWRERFASMHARRISNPARAGKGTCGSYLVFAEDSQTEDAGITTGIVEYYDEKSEQLVGAVDARNLGCKEFGTIPKCKPSITWGPGRGGGLGGLGSLK